LTIGSAGTVGAPPSATGTLDAALGALTCSGAGQAKVVGIAAIILGALTCQATNRTVTAMPLTAPGRGFGLTGEVYAAIVTIFERDLELAREQRTIENTCPDRGF